MTLEGGPKKVGVNFFASDNNLVSFEGAPEEIDGYMVICDNKILSLEGYPKALKGSIQLERNPIAQIINKFKYTTKEVVNFMVENKIYLDKGEIDEEDLMKLYVKFLSKSLYNENIPYLQVINKKKHYAKFRPPDYTRPREEPTQSSKNNPDFSNPAQGSLFPEEVEQSKQHLRDSKNQKVYTFKPSGANYLSTDKAFAYIWDGVNLNTPKKLDPKLYQNVDGILGNNYFTSRSSDKTYVNFYPLDYNLSPVPVYTGSLAEKTMTSEDKKNASNSLKDVGEKRKPYDARTYLPVAKQIAKAGPRKYMVKFNYSEFLLDNVPQNRIIFNTLGMPTNVKSEDLYRPYIGEKGIIENEYYDKDLDKSYVLFKTDDPDSHLCILDREALVRIGDRSDFNIK
jgi:hypothetical protein